MLKLSSTEVYDEIKQLLRRGNNSWS